MLEVQDKNVYQLYSDVRAIIEDARRSVCVGINTVQIDQNWRIGRRIVEEEQKGEARAEYGKRIVSNLSTRLTAEYGEGYSERFFVGMPTILSDFR